MQCHWVVICPREEAKKKLTMTIMVGIRNVHGAYDALTRNLPVCLVKLCMLLERRILK